LSCLRYYVLILILWPLSSYAEGGQQFNLADLYECDPIYCPSGSSGQSAAAERLRADLGIDLATSSETLPRPSQIRVIQADFISRAAQVVRGINARQGAVHTATVGGASGAAAVTGQSDGATPPPNQQGTQSGGDPSARAPNGTSGFSPSGFGGPGQMPQAMGQGGNHSQLHGGFLYGDDGPRTGSQKNSGAGVSHNQVGASSMVAQNNRNAQVHSGPGDPSGSQDTDSRAPASLGAAGVAGGFAGGQGAVGPGSSLGGGTLGGTSGQGGSPSALQRLAKSLGLDQFFGASGGAQGSRQGRDQQASSRQAQAKQRGANQPLQDPRAVLQAQFDRYQQRRGTASGLEFGDSRTFLFKGMCEHYVRYARQNGIPNDHARCPEK
jgi:hypothetical protein